MQKEEGRKKKTDMLQRMLDLPILRTLRQGPLNGSRHYESHPDCFGRGVSRHHVFALSGSPGWRPAGWSKLNGEIAENNRRAKFHKLTASGKNQLDEEWETWKRFSGAVELTMRDA